MLLILLRSYVTWLLISALVCSIGTLLTLLVEPQQARDFFVSYVYYWNGLVVGTSGFGALHFALSTYKQQFNYLISQILAFQGDEIIEVYFELEKLYSFSNKQLIAIPVFVVGASILYICGYPLNGFPKSILWISSSSMFYAGGLMLAYTIHTNRLFNVLERNVDKVQLQDNVHILELENFNLYLSTLFLIATIALYFAFRGTLTANFTFVAPHDLIKKLVYLFIAPTSSYKAVRQLLIYPIIIFLPYAIFSGFYIRFVLRKIYLMSIKRKILEIDELTKPVIDNTNTSYSAEKIIEIRNVAMDLKAKIISNNKVLPLVDIKDSPSIVLLAVILIQFIVHNDATIKGFLSGLLGITM
jgi:hypothetical protein